MSLNPDNRQGYRARISTTGDLVPNTVSFKTRLGYSIGIMKPVTWFAPMWAFLCGGVGVSMDWGKAENIFKLVLGIFLSGPVLCGLSQVLNDWFDREVDAINEPQRLIPSGKVGGGHVLVETLVLSILGVAIPMYLGTPVMILTALGFILALSYSIHPIRAKRNGWIGNALVALSYEGLPWLAGSTTFGANGAGGWSSITSLGLAAAMFYSLGAHGIMTINDFKSIKGDTQMGIKTIPVQHGPRAAAWIAIVIMNISQVAVITLLVLSGKWVNAGIVAVLLVGQFPLQRKFLNDPKGKAIWYNTTGTTMYVYGMLFTAIGIGIN
ncbi:chlorophyll synthase ChlG [Candidatus Chlorohelix sp.]|uniref:chlorophyll synthase ChlG n=1 Tax=Candidatus Chlorohelix sp. TaxID=3139201 RepID=UPI0030272A6E